VCPIAGLRLVSHVQDLHDAPRVADRNDRLRRSVDGGRWTGPGSARIPVVVQLAHVDWVTSAPQLPAHLVGGLAILDDEQDLLPDRRPGAINESKLSIDGSSPDSGSGITRP
jgi:hypothetical protein